MKRFFAFLVVLGLLGLPLKALAKVEVVFYDEFRDFVLERVNDFRAQPLSMLASLGLKEEEVRDKWDMDYLNEGLSPLLFNEALEAMAKAHIEEMFAYDYLGHNANGFASLEERALSFGYEGVLCGVSIMFFAFEHFVAPEEALNVLLDSLFKDALLKETAEGAPLLFLPYEDIGIAFGGGVMVIEGKSYNAYVLCLEFGRKKEDVPSLFLGRVYAGDLPLPENGVEGVAIYGWQDNEIAFAHLAISFADGSFFLPYSPASHLYLYIEPPADFAAMFLELEEERADIPLSRR